MTATVFRSMSGAEAAVPPKVLVLDDDRFDRKRVARWLKEPLTGSVILKEAATLSEFEAAVAEQRFDLVIIDFVLADGDGLDAMTQVSASQMNSNAYTVVISGNNDPNAEAAVRSKGCDRFLSKSDLSAEVLRDMVREARGGGMAHRAAGPVLEPLSAREFWANRALRRRLDCKYSDKLPDPIQKPLKSTKTCVEWADSAIALGLTDFTASDVFDFTFDTRDF